MKELDKQINFLWYVFKKSSPSLISDIIQIPSTSQTLS